MTSRLALLRAFSNGHAGPFHNRILWFLNSEMAVTISSDEDENLRPLSAAHYQSIFKRRRMGDEAGKDNAEALKLLKAELEKSLSSFCRLWIVKTDGGCFSVYQLFDDSEDRIAAIFYFDNPMSDPVSVRPRN